MNFWTFCDNNPWLMFAAIWIIAGFVFKTWNRTMRMLNIRKHGYPPQHCDADGDSRSEVKQFDDN